MLLGYRRPQFSEMAAEQQLLSNESQEEKRTGMISQLKQSKNCSQKRPLPQSA
jgi:hypothetical protein